MQKKCNKLLKMSIFFDFDVGPSGRRFRRAVNDDISDIELILDHGHTEQLFGAVDIGRLIELSTLSICMINEDKDVVGFMALCDHPNVMGVSPCDWEIWIRNMYQKFYLSRNTLFIHFMCCVDSVLEHFMEDACTSVFRNDVYLLQIVLFVNPVCDPEHVNRYQIFKKRTMLKYFAKRNDDSENNPHYMHVALRTDYCPKLKIRRAVEEDNDDIVKILDKTCPRLKEIYGSYYISEILGRHPDSRRKIIVPEYQDHAVGVMCLNSDVNFSKLQRLYELRPYYGLMKATPLEKERMKRANVLLATYGEPIMMGKLNPFNFPEDSHDTKTSKSSHIDTKDVLPRDSTTTLRKQKVNFLHPSLKPPVEKVTITLTSDDFSERHIISPSLSEMSYKSVEHLILEDDPFDYEIVNIDKSLMSLSEAFSYDLLGNIKSTQSSVSNHSLNIEPEHSYKACRKIKVQAARGRSPVHSKESASQHYLGEPNAFMIELFGLRDDVDDRHSIDLLEVAFEVMKFYDYCIIRVPAADKPFSLLEHFTFVPVKQKKCSKYAMYLAHRSSVLGRLRVRPVEFMDVPLIARFLQNTQSSETVTMIEHSFMNKESYQAFVFLSGMSMVGLGILEPPEQLKFIRTKYNIDPYHNHKYHLLENGASTGFAAIKVVMAYPVFEAHFRFFARELMRLSESSSLLWMTAYRNKLVAHKANTLVAAMVALMPRKSEMDYARVPELLKITAMHKSTLPFSTWFLDSKLSSVPLVSVSTRIVIIGASKTAMAFLNALLFGNSSTYLKFNNVTLISMNGFGYLRHTSHAVEMMFSKHRGTSEKYLKSVPYTHYVNTINGIVVEINKQDKFVKLTNGSKYYYDLLFLFIGRQYQHPDYLKPLMDKRMQCTEKYPYVRLDVPNKYVEPDYIKYNTPANVFIINHVVGASHALKYVRSLLTEGFEFKIIVYGATVHAYCCLAALLEINVPAEYIAFVEPFPLEDTKKARVSVFHNSNVDVTVGKVLSSLGIQIYRSYYFQSWTTCDNRVTHVEFLSQFRVLKLECAAFFYYGKRGLNTQAFLAINKAGMAYDGGILIDHQYRTKAPSIYAAGPATAYYRRYFGDNMQQKYYDSYEVGEKLGIQIKNELDPLFTDKAQLRRSSVRFSNTTVTTHRLSGSPRSNDDGVTDRSSNSTCSMIKETETPKNMLPNFIKPRVRYCKLPGGLQYLDVRPPGKKIPHYYVQGLTYNGIVMETFKSGYFKLHLSNDLIVDGITCLTNEKYGLEKFSNLYGLSSVVLNNVYLRYATKKLDNLFKFFRSPWACFLYHDQTDELFAMVKELLPKGSNSNKGDTLAEGLRAVSGLITDLSKKLKIRKKFEASLHIEAVTDYVIEWLSQNDILLSMYLQPSERMLFLHDIERNPLFKKKATTITKLLRKGF